MPERYPLTPTPEAAYAQRTAWNVRDSDATLVLSTHPPMGGTQLTIEEARQQGRPWLYADPLDLRAAGYVRRWVHQHRVRVLNVAGPRASQEPGIYNLAYAFVRAVLEGEPQRREADC